MFVGGQNLCHWPLFPDMQTPYEARRIPYPKLVYLFITSVFCRFKTVHCILYPFTSWCPWALHGRRRLPNTHGTRLVILLDELLLSWVSSECRENWWISFDGMNCENQTETEQFASWTWYQVIRWTLWRWTMNKQTVTWRKWLHAFLRLNVFVKHLRRRST